MAMTIHGNCRDGRLLAAHGQLDTEASLFTRLGTEIQKKFSREFRRSGFRARAVGVGVSLSLGRPAAWMFT
ncbi:hypothetical protein [Sphingobium herbicidovorans]